MAADEKWYFTKEQLSNTPSRKCGFDADKELSYRQQAANFIQDMGQKLQVSQLCINTAIVYMHRFYMFHSFTHFPWNTIAAASFFLAAKVEEQPRKLEHVIRVANHCLHREQTQAFDAKSEQYAAQSQDLVFNENVLLQTLGFDVAIDHPHTHVVRCCHLVRASKDLAQTSYFMASNSLHLTTMCLQYKPTVVACFCIHLACKWSNWQIPKSNEGKDWFYYVDKSVTSELLEQLTAEFLKIFDKCPSRLKRKISSITTMHNADNSCSNSPFDPDRKLNTESREGGPTFQRPHHHESKPGLLATPDESHKKSQRAHDPSSSQQQPQQRTDFREYREKKERERLEREKAVHHHGKAALACLPGGKHMAPGAPGKSSATHHRPPPLSSGSGAADSAKLKMHQHRSSSDMTAPAPTPAPPPLPPSLTNGREALMAHRDHRNEVHNRDLNREVLLSKELQKREYLQQRADVKVDSIGDSSIKVDSDNRGMLEKQRYDTNRQKIVDPKLQMKHDPNRHRREGDPKYQKQRSDVTLPNSASGDVNLNKKFPLMPSVQDKNNFINKQINSTSQRHKSPFADAAKSVPVQSPVVVSKADTRNGNHSSLTVTTDERTKPWQADTLLSVEDPALLSSPPPKKAPSLFSPEKTPPHKSKNSWNTKTPPSSGKRTTDTPQLPTQNAIPPVVSPFGSPPPKLSSTSSALKRPRTSSSSSEPEMRIVMTKLDQMSGYENIIRDSKMGIKLPKVPDIIQPICDRTTEVPLEASISKELKPPDLIRPFNTSGSESSTSLSQPLVNGIDTDPTVISNLLKEAAPTLNHLPVMDDTKPAKAEVLVATTTTAITTAAPTPVEGDKHKSEHHHKSEKKKKKDKHKHKDKEKSKEEKEKKKKHKDKDKERHKIKSDKSEGVEAEAPLKITITKDKLQPTPEQSGSVSGLKVKISKDRLKTDAIVEPTTAPASTGSSLKIKISKDQIHYNSVVDSTRKRDREKTSPTVPPGMPPTKVVKTSNYNRNDNSRQNGRNSYNKVAQMGDGEASQLRLAESKYHSKGASKAS